MLPQSQPFLLKTVDISLVFLTDNTLENFEFYEMLYRTLCFVFCKKSYRNVFYPPNGRAFYLFNFNQVLFR